MSAVLVTTPEPTTSLRLPPPRLDGGCTLREALQRRHSARRFSSLPLPPQMLGDLLWAAYGVNRQESGGRTAPSAHGWREIDVYVAMETGLFRYDAPAHALELVVPRDLRAATGMQDFVAGAALDLVYVADLRRVSAADAQERRFFCAANAGFVAENVYLFCAAEGLATVVRGMVDRRALAAAMGLHAQQRVLLAQTVGYPA